MSDERYFLEEELWNKLRLSLKVHWFFPLFLIVLTFVTFSDAFVDADLNQILERAITYFYPVLYPSLFIYLYNILIAFLTRRRLPSRVVRTMLACQFVLDIGLTTFLVQSYVGVDSVFTFLYPLIIIMGGLFLSRDAGLLMATLSSILYAGALLLGYFGLIESEYFSVTVNRYLQLQQEDFIYFSVAIKIIFFHVIALTAGALKELIDQTRGELFRAKRETEEVIANMPSGVISVTATGQVKHLNERGKLILHRLHGSAALGRHYRQVLPAEFTKCLDQAMLEKMVCNAKLSMRRGKDAFFIDVQAAPLKHGEDIVGGVLIFNDVTGTVGLRRQLERGKRLALVGKMSANVAHGVRGPVQSALRYAEVVRNRQQQAKLYLGELTMLTGALERADKALSRILEMTTAVEYHFVPVDLKKMLRQIWENRVDEFSRHKIRWLVEGSTVTVKADTKQLKNVFNHIIDNSLQALNPGGELRIILSHYNETREKGNWVSIRIVDNGSGIPASFRPRIFDPFCSGRNREGLGLTVSAKIIDDHGGHLMLEESQEGNTVFLLLLEAAEDGNY